MHLLIYINFAHSCPCRPRSAVSGEQKWSELFNYPCPTYPSIQWVASTSLGVKRPEHEVDHSSPSSTKYNNELSYTSAPPICLYCADSDSFTLLYIYLQSVWEVVDRSFREFFACTSGLQACTVVLGQYCSHRPCGVLLNSLFIVMPNDRCTLKRVGMLRGTVFGFVSQPQTLN